eukprot:9569164-Prorocentrum_lima.AAC.1
MSMRGLALLMATSRSDMFAKSGQMLRLLTCSCVFVCGASVLVSVVQCLVREFIVVARMGVVVVAVAVA